MNQVVIELTPEAQAVLAKFQSLPLALLRAMAAAVDTENQYSVGHIQSRKLSERGPNTLGVVTNRLRHSVRATKAEITPAGIESAIGSNVVYAGVHEFGINEQVTVKAHIRRTANRFLIDNGARTVSRSQASRLGVLTARGKARKGVAAEVQGSETTVRQQVRQMKFPARHMFREGVRERLPNYREALSKAVVNFDGGAA